MCVSIYIYIYIHAYILVFTYTHTHTHTHMIELSIIRQTSVNSVFLCLKIYIFLTNDDLLMTGMIETRYYNECDMYLVRLQ